MMQKIFLEVFSGICRSLKTSQRKREITMKQSVKKLIVLVFSLLLLLISANAMASEVINAGWNVASLHDEEGISINYLEMDVEFGKRFFTSAGAIGFVDGSTSLFSGSGYVIGQDIYFSIKMDVHVCVVRLNSTDFNGDIILYGHDGQKIDSGTVHFIGAE